MLSGHFKIIKRGFTNDMHNVKFYCHLIRYQILGATEFKKFDSNDKQRKFI